ncbi:MAG: hypothetical protein ACPGVO_07435 [Spirulinaceae cyanobacterium]
MKRPSLSSIPLFCLTYTVPFAVLEGVVWAEASFAQDVAPDVASAASPAPAPVVAPTAPAPPPPVAAAPAPKPQKAIAAPPPQAAPPAPKPAPQPAAAPPPPSQPAPAPAAVAPPPPQPAPAPPPVTAAPAPASQPEPTAASKPPAAPIAPPVAEFSPTPEPEATPIAPPVSSTDRPAASAKPAATPSKPTPVESALPNPAEPSARQDSSDADRDRATIGMSDRPTPRQSIPDVGWVSDSVTQHQPIPSRSQPSSATKVAKPATQTPKLTAPTTPESNPEPDSLIPNWLEVSFWRDRLLEEPIANLTPDEQAELRRLRRELGTEPEPLQSDDLYIGWALPPTARPQGWRALHAASLKPRKLAPQQFPEPPIQIAQTAIAQDPTLDPTTLLRILAPQPGESESEITLIVQYGIGNSITVTVNAEPIPEDLPTVTEEDPVNQVLTQIWYGLQLQSGENVIAIAPERGETQTLSLTVAPPSDDVLVEVFPTGTPLVPADGRSTLPIEGIISYAGGDPLVEETLVTLTATAGEFVGADFDPDAGGFQVQAINGRFQALLRSANEAQKVRIRAAIANPRPRDEAEIEPYQPQLEAFTEVQYTTHLRPSLVSGVAHVRWGPNGTDYWGSRSDFLNPADMSGTELDATTSFFATGAVGEWLFTGAFNSDRPLNKTCDGVTRLFRGPQHCEQDYPVYGDSSTVDYLTPSTDQVYVRLERTPNIPGAEPDYLMWGDYHTTEVARESQTFSAVTRQLHGFKGNYNIGNLQFTAFYSPDTQGFQRDTIAPDGTSGYYFLSQRPLIPGSESVFIEQESLEEPGLVTNRVRMSRGADYEIDADRGTILFRRPIQRLETQDDGTSLVQQIVVTYQFDGTNNSDTNIFSGRLQYNFSHDLNAASWAGVTYFKEDQGDLEYELYGADVQLPLGENGAIVAEYAHSSTSVLATSVSGSAYRFKLHKQLSATLTVQGYYRSVEENFANDASASFRPGQTRYGMSLTASLNTTTRVTAAYDHQKNFGTAATGINDPIDLFDADSIDTLESAINNDLTTIRVGIAKDLGKARLAVSFVNRSREDHVSDTFDSNTSQVMTNFTVPLTEALSFRAKNELNLGDGDGVYPNRTTLGMNWAVTPGVDVRLAHQFQEGSLFGDNAITRLDTVANQQLFDNTDMTTRYSIVSGINGLMGEGAIGLNHRWQVAPGLRVNLGYEQVLNDLFGATGAGSRFGQPVVLGQRSSSLGFFGGESYSVAAEYTANPDFTASARFERRNSSGGTNTVWGAAASGKLSPALTTLFRYQQASSANGFLEDLGDTISAKLGMAYRNPSDDRFNALLSYEYRKNPASIPQTLLIGSGTQSEDHTLAMEMIYAPDWRWEFYGKYATRYSRTDLAGNFSNSSQVYLGQLRATHRLGYRTDLLVEGRSITQPSANYSELGAAVEFGYYLTPDLRLGLGYSFGSVEDGGFTGYRANSGLYLGLTFKVNELFGGFGRQRVAPTQQEEALVSQRE